MTIDKFIRQIESIRRNLEQLEGEHSIPLNELFNDEFMLRNTDFDSIDALFKSSGFKVESQDDFEAIPDEPWNVFILEHTRFSSWEEMRNAAVTAWAHRQLELD